VEDRQGFIDGDPYQPAPESTLTIQCCGMARGCIQTITHSNSGFIGIAEHAVYDAMEQAAIPPCPLIKGDSFVCRSFPDRNSFLQLHVQIHLRTPLSLPSSLVLSVLLLAA
jgi:hypothetical protein